ncbi:hypothetical protein ACSMFS_02705 [Shewanella xiamenensis]|uniref:hypothetical protein n=1 Tax=Shewanella xiamenensis TaxID=332186 RepID=UPI003F199C21
MGCLFFFDETVELNEYPGVKCKPQQVAVVDNHLIPEIVIGPVGEAYDGLYANFHDWQQFERFVDAVNDLHARLKSGHK